VSTGNPGTFGSESVDGATVDDRINGGHHTDGQNSYSKGGLCHEF
jgi:hypothetical protein